MTSRWCYIPNMKNLGLVVSDKIFENWKPIFWPCDLLMQPTGTIWTTLVGDHPGIIPVKLSQNPMSGFRGEDVQVKKFTHDGRPTKTDHNSSPWAQKGELKMYRLHLIVEWSLLCWDIQTGVMSYTMGTRQSMRTD